MEQYNKSAILLEKNGKMYSSNCTNHIKVQLSFTKDIIVCGDLSMYYFPTEKMWAHVFTKHLHRTTFKKIRAMLMNCLVDYIDSCTKDMDKIEGVFKIDYFSIPSHSTKPLEKKLFFFASPQECVEVVSKQWGHQNSKEPKVIHLEPVVRTSDYYFSRIGEVPQFTYPRRSTICHQIIRNLPILEHLGLSTNLSVNIGLLF